MFAFVMTEPSSRSGRQDGITENCIVRIAAGDRDALTPLYRQTSAAVYGFALSILKNKQDAEDVLQDAYLRIWNAAGSYTPGGKPLAWILTVTRNLALMRIRERSRTVEMAPGVWQDYLAEEAAGSEEDRLMLASLLETLSDQERQIVMLHAMTGWKHREIAELLHLPLPTVLSKYNRALKKLRNVWKEATEQ